MFSLFRKKSKAPEWAGFFSSSEYADFIHEVEQYFNRLGVDYTIDDGVVNVNGDEHGFPQMGLGNLAQTCKRSGRSNFKSVISNHFDSMQRTNEFEKSFKTRMEDFDAVKEFIGVRIYPDEYISSLPAGFTIVKDFAPELKSMLVFDLPEAVQNLQPEQCKSWNKSMDELFELGIANIRKKYTFELSPYASGNIEIWTLSEDHFFGANILFDINNHPELTGPQGALVGIPHRHTVMLYPIKNLSVVEAIHVLLPAVYGMFQEGPGSISSKLYWYKDGHYDVLPYDIKNGKLDFYPPERFVQMLNTLEQPE